MIDQLITLLVNQKSLLCILPFDFGYSFIEFTKSFSGMTYQSVPRKMIDAVSVQTCVHKPSLISRQRVSVYMQINFNPTTHVSSNASGKAKISLILQNK